MTAIGGVDDKYFTGSGIVTDQCVEAITTREAPRQRGLIRKFKCINTVIAVEILDQRKAKNAGCRGFGISTLVFPGNIPSRVDGQAVNDVGRGKSTNDDVDAREVCSDGGFCPGKTGCRAAGQRHCTLRCEGCEIESVRASLTVDSAYELRKCGLINERVVASTSEEVVGTSPRNLEDIIGTSTLKVFE